MSPRWRLGLVSGSPGTSTKGGNLQGDELPNDGPGAGTLLRAARQKALDQPDQRARQRAGKTTDVRGRVAAVPAERLIERARRIGQLSRQHLEQHYPQAEQITAQVGLRPRQAQFRRQVIRGAQDVALAEKGSVLPGTV